jgi:threonine dehydrogenase-like Zn-dependent dehydrogenase
MVLGAGMIGLGVIAHLKSAGAGLIIVSETIERRASLARKLGADYVFNPAKTPDLKEKVLEINKGRGVDIVFDCSGAAPAFQSAPNFLRHGGQLVVVGMIDGQVPIYPTEFAFEEWQMQGISCYYSDEFPMTIEFLERGTFPVDEIVTSKISVSDINTKGFDVLFQPKHDEIKILVAPD